MKTKIKRRSFIRTAATLGSIGAMNGTFGVSGNAVAQPAAGSSAQEGIEPNTIKRRGVGFRGYDPDRAFPGLTLFAPSANNSPRISNAQRLPNGNTLINERWFGRFFEVTPEGAVVWEYINPYFGGSTRPQEQTNQVFRAYRYTAAEIARAEAAT